MKKVVIFLLFLKIIFFVFASTENQKETLEWNTFTLAGYYNLPSEEKGIADKILDYYIKELPDYKHIIKEMPIIRLFKQMEKVKNGGFIGPGKTILPSEQLSNVLTSTVHLVMPPAGIAIRKEDFDTVFLGGKNVSIKNLLEQSDKITCFWIKGATIHPKIRDAVESYVSKNKHLHPNVHFMYKIEDSAFYMLMAKRVDYYPTHAIPFQYECIRSKRCCDNVLFIPVNESMDDVITYTFATKTVVGREIINRINDIHKSEGYKIFITKLVKEHYPPHLINEYIKKNLELVGTTIKD